MFSRENIGDLSLYTEGNQGKTKSWRIKSEKLITSRQICQRFLPYGIQEGQTFATKIQSGGTC